MKVLLRFSSNGSLKWDVVISCQSIWTISCSLPLRVWFLGSNCTRGRSNGAFFLFLQHRLVWLKDEQCSHWEIGFEQVFCSHYAKHLTLCNFWPQLDIIVEPPFKGMVSYVFSMTQKYHQWGKKNLTIEIIYRTGLISWIINHI